MRRLTRGALFHLLLLAGAARGAVAQQSYADSVAAACMQGDTSTAWLRVQSAWRDDTTRHWSNDSLRLRLLELARADQEVRDVPGITDSMQDSAFVGRMMARDAADSAALRTIIDRFGWPGRSLVGSDGASAAWLVAQHIYGIQPEVLRRMQALPAGEVSPTDLAMLEDRVNVTQGKAQRFGTQLNRENEFDSIADVAHLDERRAAAGLPPLGVYLCMMRAFTGRDMKDPRTP
jgi:Family of unknown function (DUF6624)